MSGWSDKGNKIIGGEYCTKNTQIQSRETNKQIQSKGRKRREKRREEKEKGRDGKRGFRTLSV